jgi:hypothetical protein
MEALRMDAFAIDRLQTGPYGAPGPVLRHHMRIERS